MEDKELKRAWEDWLAKQETAPSGSAIDVAEHCFGEGWKACIRLLREWAENREKQESD